MLSPVALQVALNMALEGKLQPGMTEAVLNHAHEINSNYDTWLEEVKDLGSRAD